MKKAISLAIALCLVIGLFSITAFAGGTTVAKIGTTEFESIDEAVAAAASGDTIEVLADDDFNINLIGTGAASKSLTFTGAATLTVTNKTVNGYKGDLTFNGTNLIWNGGAEWNMFAYAGSLNINNATVAFVYDSAADNKTTGAIYSSENDTAQLNVVGGTFEILASNAKGTGGTAIQLGTTGNMAINVMRGSTFVIDGANNGYTNSPSITVTDSTFSVLNCTANASNGGSFRAERSVVEYMDNAVLGLSCDDCTLINTEFTASDNGANGMTVGGNLKATDGSKITVTGNRGEINSKWTIAAGISVAGTDSVIDSSCELLVDGNDASGIVVKAGAALDLQAGVITNNTSVKNAIGGGIYNLGTVTVADGVVICNNTADEMGDDIYNADDATITLPAAAAEVLNDCDDDITGWFEDGKVRWDAHGDEPFMNEVEAGTFEGFIALKAAHGEIVPEEVIIEDETPLAPAEPVVEDNKPAETPAAVTPATPAVVVADETPLEVAPNTADETPVALFAAMVALGAAGVVVTSKKNED